MRKSESSGDEQIPIATMPSTGGPTFRAPASLFLRTEGSGDTFDAVFLNPVRQVCISQRCRAMKQRRGELDAPKETNYG
jgi:hypothetical protein